MGEEIDTKSREWEARVKEPESMPVGTLNRVVRDLREALYQGKLREQEQAARIAKLKQGHCKDCCCARSWAALKITTSGVSIPEHIEALREERDKLAVRIAELEPECDRLHVDVGRLHALLQRANALLPPEEPIQQEIEAEYETCTQRIEQLEAENERLAALVDVEHANGTVRERERDQARERLRQAREDARTFARAIDRAVGELVGRDYARAAAQDARDMLRAVDTSDYTDGGEPWGSCQKSI